MFIKLPVQVLFCVVFVVVVLLCDVDRNKRLETLAYAHKIDFFLRVKVKRSKGEGTLLTAQQARAKETSPFYHIIPNCRLESSDQS